MHKRRIQIHDLLGVFTASKRCAHSALEDPTVLPQHPHAIYVESGGTWNVSYLELRTWKKWQNKIIFPYALRVVELSPQLEDTRHIRISWKHQPSTCTHPDGYVFMLSCTSGISNKTSQPKTRGPNRTRGQEKVTVPFK